MPYASWKVEARGLPEEVKKELAHRFDVAKRSALGVRHEQRSVERVKQEVFERLDWLITHKMTRTVHVRASAGAITPDDKQPGGTVMELTFEMPE